MIVVGGSSNALISGGLEESLEWTKHGQRICTMNKPEQLTVLHSFPVWLPQTQTWMRSQVAELQRSNVNAHVVCEETANLDRFGVGGIHCLLDQPWWRQRYDKAIRRLHIRRHLQHQIRIGKMIGAQIVHSHFGDTGWMDVGAVRKLRAKHVVTFYGWDVSMLPQQKPMWCSRYKRLFAEADLILCEGTQMANSVVALGCPESRVRVQHLGIDLSLLNFKPRLWKRGDMLRVMIAAAFREKKGIPYAIEALSELAQDVPLELTVIGDAGNSQESREEKARICTALERTGLSGRTRMLGYQSYEVMLEEAYRHHLFLHPSVTASNGDTEGGAPVCIIEMLATGMPVVSTYHCDIPEVMREMGRDFLVPERRSDELSRTLRNLLDNWAALSRRLYAQRAYIESEYDIGVQTRRLIQLYQETLRES